MELVFQSPDGDFVYSDGGLTVSRVEAEFGFNPLTGISSILTGRRRQRSRAETFVSIP